MANKKKGKLECPYCGKGGFVAQGPLNSHMKALHGQETLPDPEAYELTYQVRRIDEPGPHVISCPACQQPRQVWIKEDGTIASSDDPEIPKPVSSSDGSGVIKRIPKRNAHPVVIKNRFDMRWNEEEDRWKHTVCMMGTHGRTAPEMPWNEVGITENWLLNDAHGIDYVSPHVEAGRVHRWWQLHHRWRITRRATRNATDHWQWLQDVETVPRIIMQRKFAEVPHSEGYPLREVCEMFLGGKLGRGAGYAQYYFTNTFSYMFAQILYEKKLGIKDWERIELYGCELEQLETEYFRQRPGIEFWFGLCVAAGIEIYVPHTCYMAYAQDVKANEYGQQQMVQYPGYMAYGFLSPSLEEAKAQNLPIGVDPREESVLMAWDDYEYTDFVYAFNEGLAWMDKASNMIDFDNENDALEEWMDTCQEAVLDQ